MSKRCITKNHHYIFKYIYLYFFQPLYHPVYPLLFVSFVYTILVVVLVVVVLIVMSTSFCFLCIYHISNSSSSTNCYVHSSSCKNLCCVLCYAIFPVHSHGSSSNLTAVHFCFSFLVVCYIYILHSTCVHTLSERVRKL